MPVKFKLDRISSVDSTELAELRANVASMKAENQRLVESLTDELNQLVERVTELEDRARRPWWRRALDPSGESASRLHEHVRGRWQGYGHSCRPGDPRIATDLRNIECSHGAADFFTSCARR